MCVCVCVWYGVAHSCTPPTRLLAMAHFSRLEIEQWVRGIIYEPARGIGARSFPE